MKETTINLKHILMPFIDDCQKKLDLFIKVFGHEPKNGSEFVRWCDFVDANSQSISKPELLRELFTH